MKARSIVAVLGVLGLTLSAAAPLLAQGPDGKAPQAVPAAAPAPVIEWWYDQLKPAVAYGAGKYLVLWEHHDETAGSQSWIYSRVVGSGGTPFGIIYAPGGDWLPSYRRLAPDVGYNSATGRFLGVWEFVVSDADHDIYARAFDGDGVPLGVQETGTLPQLDSDYNPALAANPTNGQYLLAFERHVGGEFGQHDIYAVLVDGWTGAAAGPVFAVDTTTVNQRNPAVVYDSIHNQYLVVWEELVLNSCEGRICYNIIGRRVSAVGALQGERITIGQLGGGTVNPASPSVAFNSRAEEFLVVWSDHNFNTDTNWDIVGRFVNTDGAVLSWISISGGASGETENRLSPSVAYDANANEYLVAYEFAYSGVDHDIYYQRVAPNGALRGLQTGMSWTSAWESTPDVASGGGGAYLVAWEDKRNDNGTNLMGFDIFAGLARTGAPAYLPVMIRP